MKDIIRLFIASWYLLGWVLHVYLGLNNPGIYRPFGQTALIPAFTTCWYRSVMPQITALALLLAAFELVVGILLIGKGRWVKIGLALGIAFNLFLVQLGLSYPAPDGLADFLVNRLPNLLFIVLQIPLFWGKYTISLPAVVRGWSSHSSGV
jgi:hypothetical protein